MSEVGLTRLLVRAALGPGAPALPPTVASAAAEVLRRSIADSTRTAEHPVVDALARVGVRHGGRGTTAVAGRTELLDPFYAAAVTATAVSLGAGAHARLDAAVVGALVGATGLSGFEPSRTARAAAFGFDLAARVEAVLAESSAHGWDPAGIGGTVAATLAASIALEVGSGMAANALGVAASATVGLASIVSTPLGPLHPGKAAANGLLAVCLAREGLTGSTVALEAPRGLFGVVAPLVDAAGMADGFGMQWRRSTMVASDGMATSLTGPVLDVLGLSPS